MKRLLLLFAGMLMATTAFATTLNNQKPGDHFRYN